jgi:hypothetical protein
MVYQPVHFLRGAVELSSVPLSPAGAGILMFFEKLDTPGTVVQNVVAVAGIREPLSHGLRRYLGLRMPDGFVFNRRSQNIKP